MFDVCLPVIFVSPHARDAKGFNWVHVKEEMNLMFDFNWNGRQIKDLSRQHVIGKSKPEKNMRVEILWDEDKTYFKGTLIEKLEDDTHMACSL